MPNGYDKNWIRLCAAIDGFRVRYGRWPTRVLLSTDLLLDIRNLFTSSDVVIIESKLHLVAVDSRRDIKFVAEDDAGGSYNYSKEGFAPHQPDVPAKIWLGVTPKPEQSSGEY